MPRNKPINPKRIEYYTYLSPTWWIDWPEWYRQRSLEANIAIAKENGAVVVKITVEPVFPQDQ